MRIQGNNVSLLYIHKFETVIKMELCRFKLNEKLYKYLYFNPEIVTIPVPLTTVVCYKEFFYCLLHYRKDKKEVKTGRRVEKGRREWTG